MVSLTLVSNQYPNTTTSATTTAAARTATATSATRPLYDNGNNIFYSNIAIHKNNMDANNNSIDNNIDAHMKNIDTYKNNFSYTNITYASKNDHLKNIRSNYSNLVSNDVKSTNLENDQIIVTDAGSKKNVLNIEGKLIKTNTGCTGNQISSQDGNTGGGGQMSPQDSNTGGGQMSPQDGNTGGGQMSAHDGNTDDARMAGIVAMVAMVTMVVFYGIGIGPIAFCYAAGKFN